MDRDPDDTSRGFSRRALFARAAALGAGAMAIGADASMLQTRPGAVPARPPLSAESQGKSPGATENHGSRPLFAPATRNSL